MPRESGDGGAGRTQPSRREGGEQRRPTQPERERQARGTTRERHGDPGYQVRYCPVTVVVPGCECGAKLTDPPWFRSTSCGMLCRVSVCDMIVQVGL
ncbi:hypothetical protein NDU88_005010 [Pleurodeles waltl]|uniref:Uncharacterized protein n=1 Tax=Pleurodeles waltl TaxID=8319 RepID=A0AAV7TB10_PLEWA|nr:hypothetical protein NDU88_005010 [Pleurodeles waltl]